MTTDKIKSYVNAIEKSWNKRPFFIDFTWIYDECKVDTAREMIDMALSSNLSVIPAVSVSDSKELKDQVLEKRDRYNLDLAIKISKIDLSDIDELNRRLKLYLGLPGSRKDRTHIIVDLKDVHDKEEYLKMASLTQRVLCLNEWKTLILASGAFPVDLSGCSREDPTILPRNDWLWWTYFSNSDPDRIPTFADYGIRHPIYFESHLVLHPTTSIRYTIDDGWRVFKGRQRMFGDYLANAAILVTLPEYKGADYSVGDAYIADKADHFPVWSKIKLDEKKAADKGSPVKKSKASGTGSTESWLNAGFNHHMSVVADQASS